MKRIFDKKLFIVIFILCVIAIAIAIAVAIISGRLRFDYKGHREGIYILREPARAGYTFTDDIYLEEQDRIVFFFDFEKVSSLLYEKHSHNRNKLDFDWYTNDGSGCIRSHLSGNRMLITNFSRFVETNGHRVDGLFVGGSPPYHELHSLGDNAAKNESGMAYHDGSRWFHIWCNVNEALNVGPDLQTTIYPSDFVFIDSSILSHSDDMLALRSRHRSTRADAHVDMTRIALFRANDTYFTLVIRLRNTGDTPLPYAYIYGDEPWVGNFGTSIGNVGWSRNHLYYNEGRVNPTINSFAGMANLGNPVVNENESFSGMANFIEWHQASRPDTVFFANEPIDDIDDNDLKPLADPGSRSIMLRWGPRLLQPGQSQTMIIAVGMAQTAPGGRVPVKPTVTFDIPALIAWLEKS